MTVKLLLVKPELVSYVKMFHPGKEFINLSFQVACRGSLFTVEPVFATGECYTVELPETLEIADFNRLLSACATAENVLLYSTGQPFSKGNLPTEVIDLTKTKTLISYLLERLCNWQEKELKNLFFTFKDERELQQAALTAYQCHYTKVSQVQEALHLLTPGSLWSLYNAFNERNDSQVAYYCRWYKVHKAVMRDFLLSLPELSLPVYVNDQRFTAAVNRCRNRIHKRVNRLNDLERARFLNSVDYCVDIFDQLEEYEMFLDGHLVYFILLKLRRALEG